MLKNAALEECGSQIHNTCPELTRADKARCFGSIRLAATLLGILIITNDAVWHILRMPRHIPNGSLPT
jgi:hypothetical protein